jgi:hypothetical protein
MSGCSSNSGNGQSCSPTNARAIVSLVERQAGIGMMTNIQTLRIVCRSPIRQS